MKQIFLITAMILIFLVAQEHSYAQTLYNGVGHIPTAYQETWYKAGLLRDMSSVEPKMVFIIYPGDASSQIGTALTQARNHVNSTGGLAIIYFGAGIFNFTSSISLAANDSNIVFQGEGSDKTTLKFTNMKDYDCFHLTGSAADWSSSSDLDQNFNKGDSILHAASGAGLSTLSVGDWVHFVKYNFDYHTEHPPIIPDIVGQITRLQLKGADASGEWGEIKDVANMNYVDSPNTLYSLRIRKITPIKNIGIEDLKIIREPDLKASGSAWVYNIRFDCAINCWVRGVESHKPSRSHLMVTQSSHLEISGCYFHEAMDYGGGGWGYGAVLEASTTNCLVENNIFRKLRHSLTAVAGSNCNVWTFNYSREQNGTDTDRDLDLHAKYPFGHLFEQNVVEKIEADDYHGDNGPYNAFVRNHVYTTGGVHIENMDDWSTLGNILDTDSYYAPYHNYNVEDRPTIDYFGFSDYYTQGKFHNQVAYYPSDGENCELRDVSYYYSARPDFLDLGCTWPAIGTKVYLSSPLSQYIPAKDRFTYDKKTFLPDPTPKPLQYSGTLYSQKWSVSHTLTADVTVPYSMTLTIEPSTAVYVPSGKRITIQGTLIAEGTISQPITFDKSGSSKWYAIKFEDSSDDNVCMLKYCTIKNASYGVYCYKASPAIENCNFNNTTIGIYTSYGTANQHIYDNDVSYNWTGASLTSNSNVSFYGNELNYNSYVNLNCNGITIGPQINDNTIHHCTSGNGVNLYNSNPFFLRNSIYDNDDYGIYCSGSSPEFEGDQSGAGNNVVAYNGSYGIYVNSSSHPVLGGSTFETSQNSYYSNNTYEIYSLFASYLYANYCYWGGGTPHVYGNIWMLNQLSSDPNPNPHGLQKAIASAPDTNYSETTIEYEINDDARQHYNLGYELEQKGSYDAALEQYKFVISSYPQTLEAEMSLTRILICYHKTNRSSVALSFMQTLVVEKADFRVGGKALGHLTRQFVQDGDYKNALANCTSQLQKFTDSDIIKEALFTKWQIYFDGRKDESNAKSAKTEFELLFPDDYLLAFMKIAMGEWTPEMEKEFMDKLPKRIGEPMLQTAEVQIPEKFSLSGNYPNPFNPETTIKFGLPEATRVTIEIFNILGQKIKQLLDSEKPAGYHSVRWDGTDEFDNKVGAGVYLSRLQAGNFIQSQKMMLLP